MFVLEDSLFPGNPFVYVTVWMLQNFYSGTTKEITGMFT